MWGILPPKGGAFDGSFPMSPVDFKKPQCPILYYLFMPMPHVEFMSLSILLPCHMSVSSMSQ